MFVLYSVFFCSVILVPNSVLIDIDNVAHSDKVLTTQDYTLDTIFADNKETSSENNFIRTTDTYKSCINRHLCANNMNNRLCACDEKCIEYKDCCTDHIFQAESRMSTPSSYICQDFFYDTDSITHVYIKKDCHPNWTDEKYSALCANSGNDYYNISQQNLHGNIPVTGLVSHITYRNLHCAICNYEKLIRVWNNVTFEKCTFEPTKYTVFNNETMKSTLSLENESPKFTTPQYAGDLWYVNFLGLTYSCPRGDIFIDEDVKPMLDGCITTQIKQKTCSKETEMNCSGPYAVVAVSNKDNDTIYYRNKYCAFCDNKTELHCPPDGISFNRALTTEKAGWYAKAEGQMYLPLSAPPIYKIDYNLKKMSYVHTLVLVSESVDLVLVWLIAICRFVSGILSLVHLLVFAMVPELHTLGGKMLASFFAALALYYGTVIVTKAEGISCIIVKCLLFYAILVLFTWLLTMAYDIWKSIRICTRKLRNSANPKKTFWIYSFCNWILCLAPTFWIAYLEVYEKDSLFAMRFNGRTDCDFNNQLSALCFLGGPVIIVIIFTVFLYLHTCYMIFVNNFKSSTIENESTIKTCLIYLRLALLCGCAWFLIYLSSLIHSNMCFFLSTIFGSLQGIIFFCVFTCKKRNYKGVLRRIQINK